MVEYIVFDHTAVAVEADYKIKLEALNSYPFENPGIITVSLNT